MPRESSTTSSPVRLVCFDLGGVLVRICRDWKHACELIGFDQPAEWENEWGNPALGDLGVQFETGRIDEQTFIASASSVSGLPAEQVAAALNHWLIEPYPGVTGLIDALASAGVPMACLSNTNETHWAMMHRHERVGLPLDRLTHRVASHLVGVMKPQPGIYEHLEREAGREPGAILFFDDRPENVEAARRRGWQGQVIDPLGDTVAQMRQHLRAAGIEAAM